MENRDENEREEMLGLLDGSTAEAEQEALRMLAEFQAAQKGGG
jgi:hypothetical protein